jgi:hypothetical protein
LLVKPVLLSTDAQVGFWGVPAQLGGGEEGAQEIVTVALITAIVEVVAAVMWIAMTVDNYR